MTDLISLILKKGEEKRILQGEFWVYDNEIESPIKGVQAGTPAELFSHDRRYVATGYVNPASVIAFRVLSWNREEKIDREFLRKRIESADLQRRKIRPDNHYYRMVYGEADLLPGLVIDRFDEYLIVQITTAGMERFKNDIFSILQEMIPGSVLIEKALSTSREKEGLEMINRVVSPGRPSDKVITINGLRFAVDFLKSQKTGFFLDQRENYLLLQPICRDKQVLDVFSYAGAWGLHAAAFGASRVDFLEISQEYLKQTEINIFLNGFPPDRFTLTRDDAVKKLKEMEIAKEKRDIIILDPPAFVKSKHKVKEALRGYKEINLRALKMIRENGFLITCSCSHFLPKEDFVQMIYDAACDARRKVKLIEFRSQPYDHAVMLPLFQSDYLKCALIYVY